MLESKYSDDLETPDIILIVNVAKNHFDHVSFQTKNSFRSIIDLQLRCQKHKACQTNNNSMLKIYKKYLFNFQKTTYNIPLFFYFSISSFVPNCPRSNYTSDE